MLIYSAGRQGKLLVDKLSIAIHNCPSYEQSRLYQRDTSRFMNKLPTINCPHFGPCGGCTLQDPNSPAIMGLIKEFFAEHEAPLEELQIGAVTGWRTKAKLAVRGKVTPTIGLFRKGTHDVLPIPNCHPLNIEPKT